MRQAAALAIGALLPTPALAAVPDPISCEYDSVMPVGEAQVVGEGKAFFEHNVSFCEQRGTCSRRSYVLANDLVVVGRSQDGYTCAAFLAPKKIIQGWLRSERLRPLKPSTPPLKAWVGEWESGPTQEISISSNGSGLNVEGSAYYVMYEPNGKPIPGAVNTGEIAGEVTPRGNALHISDPDGDDKEWACTADFRLLGSHLFVQASSSCGGVNVTFNGIYSKAKVAPKRHGSRP